MISRPIVSVIIPCYNVASFLPGAIGSIHAQGVANCEIIIIDDCSQDGTLHVANALAQKDRNIRVLPQAVNAGPAAARNRGLEVATGRYVCFLDADDEYAPGFLAATISHLKQNRELAGIVCNIELIDCDREVHPVQRNAIMQSLPSNVILRRSIVDFIGGFPEDRAFRGPGAGEDLAFRSALRHWFKLATCREAFLRYRVRTGGHFERFLNRTRVENGELVFSSVLPEEENGVLDKAIAAYLQKIASRVSAVRCLR